MSTIDTSPSATPDFMDMCYRAKRAEAFANVDGIRDAQLHYKEAFDMYVPCGSRAEAEATLRRGNPKAQRDWEVGTCWDTLGWAPDGKVRGAYWAEVSSEHEHLEVWGIIDIDGDGEFAVSMATDSLETVLLSDKTIW